MLLHECLFTINFEIKKIISVINDTNCKEIRPVYYARNMIPQGNEFEIVLKTLLALVNQDSCFSNEIKLTYGIFTSGRTRGYGTEICIDEAVFKPLDSDCEIIQNAFLKRYFDSFFVSCLLL